MKIQGPPKTTPPEGEKPENRQNSFQEVLIGAFSKYIDKNNLISPETKKPKNQTTSLEDIIKETDRRLDQKGNNQEQKIKDALKYIKKESSKIESIKGINILHQKISSLEKKLKSLEKQSREEPEKKFIQGIIRATKRKQITLMLKEISKDLPEESTNTQILGERGNLLENIDQLQKTINKQQKYEGDFLDAILDQKSQSLYGKIKKLYKAYVKERQNIENEKQETISTQAQLQADILKKESIRKRRSARIHFLLKQLENSDYMSPDSQKNLIQLIQNAIEDLRNENLNIHNFDDHILKNIKEDVFKQLQVEEENFISDTFEKLKQHQERLQERLSKEEAQNVAKRQEVIKKSTAKLKQQFGKEGELAQTRELLNAVSYEEQIKTREKTDIEETTKNFVEGIQDLSKEALKEEYKLRNVERHADTKVRTALALNHAQERIMEKVQLQEKIREIHGGSYYTQIEAIQNKEVESLENTILEEIEFIYNISENGGSVAIGTTDIKDIGHIENLEKLQISDEERTQIRKRLEENKKAYNTIKKHIKKLLDTEKKSKKIKETLQEKSPNQQEEFLNHIKLSFKLAKLRYDLSNNDPLLDKIDDLQEQIEDAETDTEKHDLLSNFLKDKNLESKITKSFKAIDTNLRVDNKNPKSAFKFDMISSPAGITIVTKNHNQLKEMLFADDPEDTHPDTLSLFIKSKLDTSKLPNNHILKDWDGNFSFVSTDRGEGELTHEVKEAVSVELNTAIEEEIMEQDDTQAQIPNKIYSRLEDGILEITQRLESGYYIDQLQQLKNLPEDLKNPEMTSLAMVSYLTKDSLKPRGFENLKDPEKQTAENIIETNIKEAYKFNEIIKSLIYEYCYGEDGNFNYDHYIEITELTKNIVLQTRDESGRLDLQNINKELLMIYNEWLSQNTLLQNRLKKLESIEDLPEQYLIGREEEQKLDDNSRLTLKNLTKAGRNEGFGFMKIKDSDRRGLDNRLYDAITEGSFKVEDNKKRIGTDSTAPISTIAAADLPFPFSLAANLLYHKKGLGFDPGPNWLDQTQNAYDIFGQIGNFKHLGRGTSGIRRAVMKKLGPIGQFFLSNNEQNYRWASGTRMFDIFGPAFKPVLDELAPNLDPWLAKKFPGRPESYDFTGPNAEEIFKNHLNNVIQGALGSVGLNKREVQRVMAEHQAVIMDFSSGALTFDISLGNLDKVEYIEDPDNGSNLVKRHRGAMNTKIIEGVSTTEYIALEEDVGRLGGDAEKARENALKNSSIRNLTTSMRDVYNLEENPYTMRDLIIASNLIHDMGIHPITGAVRNEYYESEDQEDGFGFEESQEEFYLNEIMDDSHKRTNLKIAQYTWFNPNNTHERGIVIRNADNSIQGLYTLDTVNDLIYRYNTFQIYDALKQPLPEISSLQQQNKYLPDLSKGPVDEEDVKNNREQYYGVGNFGRQVLKDDYAYHTDSNGNTTIYPSDKNKENPFYNPNVYTMSRIPGIQFGDKTNPNDVKKAHKYISDEFLKRTTRDTESIQGAYTQTYDLLKTYYDIMGTVNRYEKKHARGMIVWETIRLLTKRVSTPLLLLSALSLAFLSGGAGIALWGILVNLLIRSGVLITAQGRKEKYLARRDAGRGLQSKAQTAMGSVLTAATKGEPMSRREAMNAKLQATLLTREMEALAKVTADKPFPDDDMGIQIFRQIFGRDGVIDNIAKT